MITRLFVCAFAITCTLVALFFATQSGGADFSSDWLLEDLTCEELISGYHFEVEMLDQLKGAWQSCMTYSMSPADAGFGVLHCALLKKEGIFVQGMANDLAAVYNAKPECTDK
jgi:hypothetical protein